MLGTIFCSKNLSCNHKTKKKTPKQIKTSDIPKPWGGNRKKLYQEISHPWKNVCTVNQVQIIFHSSIFHLLLAHTLFPQGPTLQREEALSLVNEFSSCSSMIGFPIDDSALRVCCGMWFPWESRLTISQIHKKTLTLTHEYSVVHSRPQYSLDTQQLWRAAGQFDSTFHCLPHFGRFWLPDNVRISLSPNPVCSYTISLSSWPCPSPITITSGPKKSFLCFMGKKDLWSDASRWKDLRGGLSGGSVGCRFLLQ